MWDHDRVIHLALAVLKIGAKGKRVGWAIGFPEAQATRKITENNFSTLHFLNTFVCSKIQL